MPRTLRTMCPMNCHPTLCGMEVTVDGDQVTITGDASNPDSEGYLCMRGKAAHEILDNTARLLHPMVRATRDGPFARTSWDTVLDRMADHMQSVGREAVGFWQGHGNWANDYAFGLKRSQMDRFANLYGCQVWNPAMICWGLGAFGAGITGAIETSTKEDLSANSSLVILWAANTVSQANTLRHVERAKRRGARIVVIDVRRTEASALADETVLVRPGTDADLALAMMHVILDEDLWDRQFVEAHTIGFDPLRVHLRGMTPAWAEDRTGVAADRIRDLARSYAQAGPAMIVMGGSSLHKGANGWAAARAISCLPAVTGNYGRAGGGLGPRHGGRSHGVGFQDLSAADQRPPGHYIPNQMEAILEALESGAVKVFVSVGSNMLSSFPDTARVRAALRRAELVIAYDIFPNQMIREVADIVLPGTIWLEEIGGKSTNTHLHLCDQVLPAAGEARPVHEVYKGLAARLGVADVYPWPDQTAAMDAALDHPATGHATVASIRAAGGRVPLAVSHVAYPTHQFTTPSGKVEFLSQRAGDMGLPTLPMPSTPDAGTGLILAHGRTFAHFHSFYDHARALPTMAAREDAPDLWISPADAQARGVADGAAIELSNARGRFRARAKVTPRIPDGTIWMRDGWPGQNTLTASAAVLPDTALAAFPFSVGQSTYSARIEVVPLRT